MSFLKKLFGFSGKAEPAPRQSHQHEGYSITPAPVKEGGQYRLSGVIEKEMNGEVKSHRLIRADLFISQEECSEATLRKAKQVIKEQGDRLFD